jgi:hypothetical protein
MKGFWSIVIILLAMVPWSVSAQGFELGIGKFFVDQYESALVESALEQWIPMTALQKEWEEQAIDLYRFYCEYSSYNYDEYGIRYVKGDDVYYIRFTDFPVVREDFSIFQENDGYTLRYNKVNRISIQSSDYLRQIESQLRGLDLILFQRQVVQIQGKYEMNLDEVKTRVQDFYATFGEPKGIVRLEPTDDDTMEQVRYIWEYGEKMITLDMNRSSYNHLKELDQTFGTLHYYQNPITITYRNTTYFNLEVYKAQVQASLRHYLNRYISQIIK